MVNATPSINLALASLYSWPIAFLIGSIIGLASAKTAYIASAGGTAEPWLILAWASLAVGIATAFALSVGSSVFRHGYVASGAGLTSISLSFAYEWILQYRELGLIEVRENSYLRVEALASHALQGLGIGLVLTILVRRLGAIPATLRMVTAMAAAGGLILGYNSVIGFGFYFDTGTAEFTLRPGPIWAAVFAGALAFLVSIESKSPSGQPHRPRAWLAAVLNGYAIILWIFFIWNGGDATVFLLFSLLWLLLSGTGYLYFGNTRRFFGTLPLKAFAWGLAVICFGLGFLSMSYADLLYGGTPPMLLVFLVFAGVLFFGIQVWALVDGWRQATLHAAHHQGQPSRWLEARTARNYWLWAAGSIAALLGTLYLLGGGIRYVPEW